jgi:hypothetical protein
MIDGEMRELLAEGPVSVRHGLLNTNLVALQLHTPYLHGYLAVSRISHRGEQDGTGS